jgi:hypothetical protein
MNEPKAQINFGGKLSMKKVISVLLIIAVLCSAFAVVGMAAENKSLPDQNEILRKAAFYTAYPAAIGTEVPGYWLKSAAIQWILQYLLFGWAWMKYPVYK